MTGSLNNVIRVPHPKDWLDANLSEPCKGAEVVTLKWQSVGVLLVGENHFQCNGSVARQSLSDWVCSFLCHPRQKTREWVRGSLVRWSTSDKVSAAFLVVLVTVFISRSPQNHKTGSHAASVTCLAYFRDMVGQTVLGLVDTGNLMNSKVFHLHGN